MKKELSVVILCVNTDLNVLNFYSVMKGGTYEGWHMADVPKEQWFVFITPAFDYIRMSTAVQIRPPCQLSQNEYEKTWHIETSNTDRVDTYKDFKYILDYLINEYNKCKKKLRKLLIREAAYVYET